MTGIPASVEESCIPACVRVAECGTKLLYTDTEGNFHILTKEQLEELAVIYNNWRCGNFESCMLDGPSAYGKVKL